MNRGGIARRLIALARALVGSLPAGLAHVHVLASMLFGALSGSAVAAASAVGGVMGPRMEEEGYDRDDAAALNIAAATTGLVIPPSNILIVYSLASGGVSIAALFVAGYLPGLVVGLALMAAAALGFGRRVRRGAADGEPLLRRLRDALPSLGLLVVVMGGIVAGVFTATEASAIAVAYSLLLALAGGELRPRDLPAALRDAAATTGIVMLLIGTSVGLSWLLAFERIPQLVAEAILGLSQEPWAVLLLINGVLLVVGTFMDMTPAVLIFTPMFLPVVEELGVDPVHFGIVMVLNLCIGLCTPPVGSVLFVGCAVAGTDVRRVVRPLWPLYLAMLAALSLVTFVPALSLWLPGLLAR
jgi:tripartite ATP-independent transporter DctM subunit